MKQIISLSIVSIAFDTAEMRRMNRAFKSLPIDEYNHSEHSRHKITKNGVVKSRISVYDSSCLQVS